MALYLHNGKLLTVSGDLATSADCCCECGCCDADTTYQQYTVTLSGFTGSGDCFDLNSTPVTLTMNGDCNWWFSGTVAGKTWSFTMSVTCAGSDVIWTLVIADGGGNSVNYGWTDAATATTDCSASPTLAYVTHAGCASQSPSSSQADVAPVL